MTWPLWFAATAPLAYLAAALAPERPFAILVTSRLAGWISLALSVLALASAVATGPAVSPTLAQAGLGLAVRLDGLGGAFCVLIAFVGLVVVTYSRNYLAGDPRHGGFVRDLCLTLAFVEGLALSGNLALTAGCWIGASLCVNRLLLFRADRQAAVLAARKRFVACRLSDISLLIAFALIWRATGAGDIGEILAKPGLVAGSSGAAAAALLALAAIFGSAQLPFHGWLLEVMEAPTPVSALLHAGVVNAGGFLLLRFAPLLAMHPATLHLLVGIGAITALFGSLVMLTQTSVKVALAYSTIAQMGFMLLECGLGAFAAALLHIVAHALYKAHAFLSAGGAASAKTTPPPSHSASAGAILAVPVLTLCAGVLASAVGWGPFQQPGAFVLGGVVLLGVVRVLGGARPASALPLAAGVGALALSAYGASHWIFARLLPDLAASAPNPDAPAGAAAIAVVAAMTGLVCLQLSLPRASGAPAWARAYALAANGFYLNTLANRWVLRLWPTSPIQLRQEGAA
ncbi:MAG: hypothetical protein JSR86_10510 [Proteobacteria bacterium]|nr:hypothetical protein [Pseudomonadota bacterium]